MIMDIDGLPWLIIMCVCVCVCVCVHVPNALHLIVCTVQLCIDMPGT